MAKGKAKITTKHAVSKEMKEIAQGLIADLCGVLKDQPIEYVLKTRQNADTNEIVLPRVGECLGPVQAANALERDIHKRGFRIVLSGNWWAKATPELRRAAVYHQLCHCYPDNGKPKILKHDFEGFRSELKASGCWTDSLREAQKVMPGQLTLIGEEEGAKPAEAAAPANIKRGANNAHIDVATPLQPNQAAAAGAAPLG